LVLRKMNIYPPDTAAESFTWNHFFFLSISLERGIDFGNIDARYPVNRYALTTF
jgi:hypothetical protein